MKRVAMHVNTGAVKSFVANFIIPIVSVGIAILLIVFFVYPAFTKSPERKAELEAAVALDESLQGKLEKLNTLIDYSSSVSENDALVSDVLATEAAVPQLLTQIDLIARESGLLITNMGYSLTDGEATLEQARSEVVLDEHGNELDPINSLKKEVIVSLGVSGSLEQLIGFLRNLENAGRVVNVTSVRYTNNTEDTAAVEASFVLSSPYVEIITNAVTDDPITFDLEDQGFQDLLSTLKELRIYRISIDDTIDIGGLRLTEEELVEETEPEVPVQQEEPQEFPDDLPFELPPEVEQPE